MLDLGYYDSTNTAIYWIAYFATLGILWCAAYVDVRERRVPNFLWFIALIPIPLVFLNRLWMIDIFFIPLILMFSVLLWKRKIWGMGDVKGIAYIGLMLGALPTILIVLLAYFVVPKKPNQPFMLHLFIGTLIASGGIFVWLL